MNGGKPALVAMNLRRLLIFLTVMVALFGCKRSKSGELVVDVPAVVAAVVLGGGNVLLGAPRLNDDIWLYGGTRKRIVESVAAGRLGRMPAHGEFLGEAKVHLLSAYVLSLTK